MSLCVCDSNVVRFSFCLSIKENPEAFDVRESKMQWMLVLTAVDPWE